MAEMVEASTVGAHQAQNATPSDTSSAGRRLAEIEEALYEDIRLHGVLVPIVVDRNLQIIDGFVRKRIADALGIDCPHTIIDGELTDEERWYLRAILNGLRRPSTVEEQLAILRGIGKDGKFRPAHSRRGQEAIEMAQRVSELLAEGKSFRQIARELDISVGTAHRYSRIGMALAVAVNQKQAEAVAQALQYVELQPGAHPAASVLAQAERTPIHDPSLRERYQMCYETDVYLQEMKGKLDVLLCTDPLPSAVLPHALTLAQIMLKPDGFALIAVDTPRAYPQTKWRTQWVVDLDYTSDTNALTGVKYRFRLFLLALAPEFNPEVDWLMPPPAFGRNIVRDFLRVGTRPESKVCDIAYGGVNYMFPDVPVEHVTCLSGIYQQLAKREVD